MSVASLITNELMIKLGDGTSATVNIIDGQCGKRLSVTVVSSSFDGLSKLQRHRLVHDCLASYLQSDLHSVSISAKTPDEIVNQ